MHTNIQYHHHLYTQCSTFMKSSKNLKKNIKNLKFIVMNIRKSIGQEEKEGKEKKWSKENSSPSDFYIIVAYGY